MKLSGVARVAAASVIGIAGILGGASGAGATTDCITVNFAQGQRLKETITHTPHIGVAIPAGTYHLSGSSLDSHDGRTDHVQQSERFEVLFLDKWGNILGTSGVSGDLADDTNSASWSGSLGTVTLPAGVTQVRGHHRGDLPADGTANSLNPLSFTACPERSTQTSTTTTSTTSTTSSTTTTEATTTTTEATTTTTEATTSTTVAPTTTEGGENATSTTVEDSDVESVSVEKATEVLGSVQTPTQLAVTGSENKTETGFALILFGAGVLAMSLRAQVFGGLKRR